jgi:uncharacterized membrane protein YphA (DoxX/SURF4 family)
MIHLITAPRKFPVAISLALRIPVGIYFIVAAVGKIEAPEGFLLNIRAYEMVDPHVAPFLAYTMPWLELICGGLLIFGLWVFEGRLLTLGMLAVFIAAVAGAMWRGLKIDCGCTGEASDPVGFGVILRNAALIAALGLDWGMLRLAHRVKPGGTEDAASAPAD